MGGYSSFPVCFAAFILKIKFVIYENNLIIGKANKFLLPIPKTIDGLLNNKYINDLTVAKKIEKIESKNIK